MDSRRKKKNGKDALSLREGPAGLGISMDLTMIISQCLQRMKKQTAICMFCCRKSQQVKGGRQLQHFCFFHKAPTTRGRTTLKGYKLIFLFQVIFDTHAIKPSPM